MNKKIYDHPINPKCRIGGKKGKWKIIGFDHAETNDYEQGGKIITYPSNFWLCECQCKYHTQKVIKESWLLDGQRPQCDKCYADDNPDKSIRGRDYTGMRVGFLEVIKPHEYTEEEKAAYKATHNGKSINRAYDCACHRCGRGVAPRTDYTVLEVSHITAHMKLRPDTASCGCRNKEMLAKGAYHTTHGMEGTRIYTIWRNMKTRCYNQNVDEYKYYGGRGIIICNEWLNSFESFYKWAMENGYNDTLTIDRINVNGNYEPSNCRWADRKTQMNNTTRNRTVNLGLKKYTMAQVADMSSVSYGTYRYRQNKKDWSENDRLFIPALDGQYGRERYREEHGIVDALIFDDNTESSNKDLYRLTPDQIKTVLDNAPTAEEVFNKPKTTIPNLLNL